MHSNYSLFIDGAWRNQGLGGRMAGVNSFTLAMAKAPFGGIKASGMGRAGIRDFLNIKLAHVAA